jgi:hypothetical protein
MTNYINPEDTVPTSKLVKVLRILSKDIQSDDGVVNAALLQIANRLEALQKENEELKKTYVKNDYFNPLPL